MKIEVTGKRLFDCETVNLRGNNVGIFLGKFSWEKDERAELIQTCRMIWDHLVKRTEAFDFTGLIRFDLVPAFAPSNGTGSVGHMYTGGVYEINGHSPECIAAAAVLNNFFPELQNNAVELAAKKILDTFGDEEIAFVAGSCLIKNEWKKFLIDELKKFGLSLHIMTEKEVMESPPPILWRWGDARLSNGVSHYSPKFTRWLFSQNESFIFNSILSGKNDFSNKMHLLSSDNPNMARLLSDNSSLKRVEDVWWSVDVKDHHNLLLKPNRGASGDGIFFGEDMYASEWIALVQKKLQEGGYSIWQTNWLPKLSFGKEDIAIDLNPAFWVNNGTIEYLYSIVRVDNYAHYRLEEKKMNVAKGAGIAGILV